MNAELAYLVGLISGDGHLELGRNRVDIRIYPKPFRRTIFKLSRKLLSKDANVLDMGLKVRITSKKFMNALTGDFELQKGSKSYTIRVPETIRNASIGIQNFYIAGWYDAEGWVEMDKRRNPPYPRIRFCVVNRNVCEFVAEVLRKNGLGRGCFASGKRFCIDVNGMEKCKKFLSKMPVKKMGLSSA